MRDFNTVKSDLILHLRLSFQKTDGEILWYDGTLDVLAEFLSMLYQETEGGRVMSDLWLYTPEICDGDYCPLDCDKCYKAGEAMEAQCEEAKDV